MPALYDSILSDAAFQINFEAIPEFLHRRSPREFAVFDFIQLVFHARGEAHVENILERFHQQIAHLFAQQRRREPALLLVHVLALHNRRNNRRIRGRAANSLFFQFLYQRRFRVPRRRLREMLIGTDCFETQFVAFAHSRKNSAIGIAFVFLLFLVLHSLVRCEIAVELHHRSGRAECVTVGFHVNRGLIENRRHHLRRHEALPDHLVELEHIVFQIAPHAFRACAQHRSDESLRALPARPF